MTIQNSKWPESSIRISTELHSLLSIKNEEWHQLKGNSRRRSAELISAALIKLISGGDLSEVEALLMQSIMWIKGKIKDPGCPG